MSVPCAICGKLLGYDLRLGLWRHSIPVVFRLTKQPRERGDEEDE